MATAQVTQTVIKDIPLSRLCVADWNARKTFEKTAMDDLTASVQQHGIHVPLAVRPIGKERWEIVAGFRRYLAAQAALLTSAPCIVRDLSDDEARQIGIIDNLQRENLPPLEEARGFSDLMDAPGATIETVAAKVGKPGSYVGRRLRLLEAILPVQEALAAGAIEVGHAMELARLDGKQQQTLLSRLNCGFSINRDEDFDESEDFDDEDDSEEHAAVELEEDSSPQWHATPTSVAELKREIGRTMLRVLENAPFPLEDAMPPMACSECPKRTINSALLFPDVTQDVCTDGDCYEGKIRAWVRFSLERADEEKKMLVLLGNQYWYDNKMIVKKNEVVIVPPEVGSSCEKQEEAIWYDGPQAGHRAIICRNHECKIHYGFSSKGPNGGSENAKQKANRKALLAKVSLHKKYRRSLFNELGSISVMSSAVDPLTVEVAQHCIERMTSIYNNKLAYALGWDVSLLEYGHRDKLRKKLESLTPAERMRAAALAIYASELAVHEYSVNTKDYRPVSLESLASTVGVDWPGLKAVAEAEQAAKVKPAKTKNAKPTSPVDGKTAAADPEAAKEGASRPAKKPTAKKSSPKTTKKPATKKAAKKNGKKSK